MTDEPSFPDYTVLFEPAKELGEQMVLDFPARVGRRPYVRYNTTQGEWEALSVGPVESTDDGRAIIGAEEFEVTPSDVREMLDEARVIQLVYVNETPFTGYEEWEYGSEAQTEPYGDEETP